MRIMFVTDTFFPTVGGAEVALWKLSEALMDKSHEVSIMVVGRDFTSPSDRLDIAKVPNGRIPLISGVGNLTKEIHERKPDVINSISCLKAGYTGTTAGRKNNVLTVVTEQGGGVFAIGSTMKTRIAIKLWRRGAIKADRLTATSREMANVLEKWSGSLVRVIPNGVDIETFKPLENNVSFGAKTILCTRRLEPKNGLEYIIRAMPHILKKENAMLVLAGEGGEREHLENLALQLDISDKVIFEGQIPYDKLPDYYRLADIVVQPSLAEAISLSCLEALASGCVLVATNTGGLGEILRDRENALLVDAFQESSYIVKKPTPENVTKLAETVITGLADDNLRKKLGRNARKTAESCSWPIIADKMLEVYSG